MGVEERRTRGREEGELGLSGDRRPNVCFSPHLGDLAAKSGTAWERESRDDPDEKSTGESTSSPVKHGEEKPIQREPKKTLGQTRQRHRDEKSDSSTRHGSCRVR